MVKRAFVATLLGGLLLFGAPTVVFADHSSSGYSNSYSRQFNRHRRFVVVDRRFDRRYYDAPCSFGYQPYYRARWSGCAGLPNDARPGTYYAPGGFDPRAGYYPPDYWYGPGYPGYDRDLAAGTVVIHNLSFEPVTLTTTVGNEVKWTWQDRGVRHTVTADDGSFDSRPMSRGEFRHAFDKPGEYAYHCEIHREMMGTVVVTP